MANIFKQLQLQTLDKYLNLIRICDRPGSGWIAAIRKGLGMSVRQLAERIGITQQSVSELEAREIDGSITLKSLRRAAEAMNCQLVYAIVPNKGQVKGKVSLKSIVRMRALKKAKELVESVDQTMMLEGQAAWNLQEKINQTDDELAKNPDSKLWD